MLARRLLLIVIACVLLISVFFPWLRIDSPRIVMSGIDTSGTSYGKPGLLTIVFTAIVLIFALLPRVWAHRICIITSALGAGWAVRNFVLLSGCMGGECPTRLIAFYFYVVAGILLLVAVLIQKQPLRLMETEEKI